MIHASLKQVNSQNLDSVSSMISNFKLGFFITTQNNADVVFLHKAVKMVNAFAAIPTMYVYIMSNHQHEQAML